MIRVLQHNCARSYKLLQTGVKCRADIVCLPEPVIKQGGTLISHSEYKVRNEL